MARFLVIGASSGIGLSTVKAALAAGHAVRAFSRSASKIPIDDAFLEKTDGDALDAKAIATALAGTDAVIQSLGVALSPTTLLSGTTLFSTATRILVDQMTLSNADRSGPKRLIAVTGLGTGDSRDRMGPLYRLAFEASLRRIYDDKDIQEMIVRRSKLDWTIVRPGFLTDQPKGTWKAIPTPAAGSSAASSVSGSISRADVAAFIIRHWDDRAYLRKAPILVT
ncbi:MAG: NAD(P)H-binding protein [Hyphomicrobiaceae bacterium]|nr:NAD(P)H-binding protein [Hyphomicrobiaceae bacterium]